MKRLLYAFAVGILTTAMNNPVFSDTPDIATQDAENCTAFFDHGLGYTTSIISATDNEDGTQTIRLKVEHDGCSGWFCKELDYFAVEAEAGTFSDITVDLLEGNFTYGEIVLGPDIGESFEGFKIDNTAGIGNGQAGAFLVTYTINGSFQDQKVKLKPGFLSVTDEFLIDDFEFVQACGGNDPVIVPYYDPLGVGKVSDIIGYELRALYFSNEEGSLNPEDVSDIYQIVGNSVLISLFVNPGEYENTLAELAAAPYNMTDLIGDPILNTITGLYPIENLLLLNDRDDLLIAASPVFPPLNNAGLITTQGDTAMRSFIARDVFDVDGSGIKVGVLSDSYNTKLGDLATDDVIKGDLPGAENTDYPSPVDIILEYPFGEASDEGRAMLQIIHDIAPGSELAFRTAFNGATDFAQGVIELKDAGCDVIVDDVTYISEPFFRDGAIAQSVDQVTAEGVSYFSAAGNFGSRSWEGTFNGVTAPEGIDGEAHNFAPDGSPEDVSQNITLAAGQYTVVLQWDDGTPGLTTSSDFDIYLANNDDIAFFGFNRVNIGGFPIEVLPFTVLTDDVQSNFQIIRSEVAEGYDTGTPTLLKYIVFRGNLEINEYDELNASTITGQANAEGAMAVGAVLYTNTPEYGEPNPTVASFSSRGGTTVNGGLRNKPEFCGPNVVNTSVDLGGGFDFEGDGFPNFVGTSAAAPHAAGLAALVLQARNKYYGDSLNPAALKNILQSTALDMYEAGYDIESGAGYLLADSALNSIINPSAFLITVTYDTTLVPGLQEIPIIISGEYLDETSEVYFNGEPLETASELQGDTAITAIIPIYDPANTFPEIQVNNQPQPGTNGLDGGLSNVVYLTTKTTILIAINDTVKTYGEQLPDFTANYFLSTLNGNLPIDSAGLSSDEMARVMNIDFTSIANSLSNVGLWGIEPDENDPLNPLSEVEATDSVDLALLENYNFVFSNGVMTINPLDIFIDPRDTSIVFNEELVNFNFDYLFNTSDSLNISPEDSEAIANAVRLVHGTALVNRPAALVQGTALVNDLGEPLLTEDNLQNVSVMISSVVRLTQGTALVNGELLDPDAFYEAAAIQNVATRLVQGTALVNVGRLVQGTALVNEFDESGALINSFPLVQGTALVNSSGSGGELSTSTFNADSNSETIVILGEGDIEILSGEEEGTVEIESTNLVTGNEAGDHFILAGAYLSNNFNITYGVGALNITPIDADFEIDPESLTRTYDGEPKPVSVTVLPEDVPFTVNYSNEDGYDSEEAPSEAGIYNVTVSVANSNYTGSASAVLNISPAFLAISLNPTSLVQFYDGSPKAIEVTASPEDVGILITYNGSEEIPVNAGTYNVVISSTDPNYVGSATSTFQILPVTGNISIDPASLSQEFTGNPIAVIINTEPEDLAVSTTYNSSESAPTNAGIYEVVVTITDPNYTGSATATLIVSPVSAEIYIDMESLNQIYNGEERSISTSTYPDGVALDISYSNLDGLPVNSGTYNVSIEVADGNYSGSSTAQFTIEKAQATLELSNLIQIYDGNNKTVSVISSPADVEYVVTYDGSSPAPVNTGIYQVDAHISDQNYFGSASAELVIDPSEVWVQFGNLSDVYDGNQKSATITTDPGNVNVEVTYSGSSDLPINAGSYQIDAIVFDDNYVGAGNSTLEITPREAIVRTENDIYGIDQGDELPDFEALFEGLMETEDENIISDLYFLTEPEFNGEAGLYNILPVATANNYSFISEESAIYVNPAGPDTYLIEPKFKCYENLGESDENGFNYLAHFTYTNNNSTDVYIPKGSDNLLAGTGYDDSNQPEIFLAGGGTFTVPYDGDILKWGLRSNSKTGEKSALQAISWMNECKTTASKSNERNVIGNRTEMNAIIFPNPSKGKVYIQYAGQDISLSNVEVYNSFGGRASTPAPIKNEHIMELDLSSESPGLYVVRISGRGWAKALNVVVE